MGHDDVAADELHHHRIPVRPRGLADHVVLGDAVDGGVNAAKPPAMLGGRINQYRSSTTRPSRTLTRPTEQGEPRRVLAVSKSMVV